MVWDLFYYNYLCVQKVDKKVIFQYILPMFIIGAS